MRNANGRPSNRCERRGIIVYYDYQIGTKSESLDSIETGHASWTYRLLGEDFFATAVGVDCRDMDYDPGDDDILEIAKLLGLRLRVIANPEQWSTGGRRQHNGCGGAGCNER